MENTAMPAPQNPPSPSDWELRRPLITRLYRDDNKTLREVMDVMHRSGFRATTKMYKSRIQTWGLDKKLKEHEARAIIHMLAHCRDKENYVYLRGRRVEVKAVESHLRRKGIAIGAVLSTGAPHVSNLICETPDLGEREVPRPLVSPGGFRIAELLCADVREYVLSSFGTGRWQSQSPNQYCSIELMEGPAQLYAETYLEMVAAYWDGDMDQPGMAIEAVRKSSAKMMKYIGYQNSATLPLIIQLCATVLVWPKTPLAMILSKQLCSIVATHDFGDGHVNMYLQRIFTRIGQLASGDEIPDYLLAVTRSSMDSHALVLGQYHPQTLQVAVILSQMMSALYGPDGLAEPLEGLLSALESQRGAGTRQSALLQREMRRLGELRQVSRQLPRHIKPVVPAVCISYPGYLYTGHAPTNTDLPYLGKVELWYSTSSPDERDFL